MTVIALVVWTVLIGASAAWNHHQQHEMALTMAVNTADANYNKDLAYRKWASSHGGVYVEPTEKTPPSPWMAHLPDRDLVANDGRKLTLMNPAYMLREMMQDFGELYGIKGRIVGIVYLSANNKADPWEEAAIRKFSAGTANEIYEMSDIEGASYLRLIRPMFMEDSCQKCHGHLGFKAGEVRGAISVSVPLAPFFAAEANAVRPMLLTHGILWLVGTLAILFIARNSARRQDSERQAAMALHASERRFREMAETIEQVFFVAEIDYSRFHYISPAFAHVWGRDVAEMDKNPGSWLQWLHPDDRERITRHVSENIGQGQYSADFRIIRPGGEVRWLHAKAFEMETAEGERQVVGCQADITGLKTTEEALRSKNASLERSNAELESFAYVAAHDLREPLRSISSFTALLERRLASRLAGEEREFLQFVKDAAIRMDSLIGDLLGLSQVGRAEAAMEPVALAEPLEQALAILKGRIAETGATVDIQAGLPEVIANRNELTQVFMNLIANGLKYRRPDIAPAIHIRWSDEGDRWHIQIEDNGIGIEPKQGYEDRVFKLFQRLHQRHEYGGGTGIGLAVCRKAIEHHGGRIWVKSDGVGLGSTFHFTLPKGA